MEIGKEQKQKILEFANDCYTQDAVLLVDYRHGIFSKELIGDLKKITKEKHKTTIASSQVSESKSNHMDYSGVDLICLNSKEANEVLVKFKTDNNFDLENLLDSDICITSGEKGSALYMNKEEYQVKGIKVDEIDSCGAGDSFLAALSLCDYKGHPEESLYLANIWAGLSVTKLGTKIPKKQELIDYINNLK
jgi:bifunctional ADP-heptose synthase (sugar kinase/adenylyltransferase)